MEARGIIGFVLAGILAFLVGALIVWLAHAGAVAFVVAFICAGLGAALDWFWYSVLWPKWLNKEE